VRACLAKRTKPDKNAVIDMAPRRDRGVNKPSKVTDFSIWNLKIASYANEWPTDRVSQIRVVLFGLEYRSLNVKQVLIYCCAVMVISILRKAVSYHT